MARAGDNHEVQRIAIHVAAGQRDFIEAGLKGAIRIRGDMRIFMQNAELVKIMADLYSQQVETTWPRGRPPYG